MSHFLVREETISSLLKVIFSSPRIRAFILILSFTYIWILLLTSNNIYYQESARSIRDRYGSLNLLINASGILSIPEILQPGTYVSSLICVDSLHLKNSLKILQDDSKRWINLLSSTFQCRNNIEQSRKIIPNAFVRGECSGTYFSYKGTMITQLLYKNGKWLEKPSGILRSWKQ